MCGSHEAALLGLGGCNHGGGTGRLGGADSGPGDDVTVGGALAPLKLTESAYYTGEDERQRKIVVYRDKVWALFREQAAITDDMRRDPPYRQNITLLKNLMGALIVKLHDDGAVQWLTDTIRGYYAPSDVSRVVKAATDMFAAACSDRVSREKQADAYLKTIHPGGKL